MEQALDSGHAGSTGEQIKRVNALRALHWLEQGWRDFTANPLPSMFHGLILSAIGWLIIVICSTQVELLALAISGFLLVGPIFGAGFYALSRSRGRGEKADFDRSLDAAMKNTGSLARLGGILALIAIGWGLISSALFRQAFGTDMPEVQVNFYRTIVEWPQPDFLVSYIASGAVLAALAFVISAVSAPMIFDRGGRTRQAIVTSVRTVMANPLAMAIWAGAIVVLTAIGFATFMAGLVVTLPLIGHATWHAYQDLVSRQ